MFYWHNQQLFAISGSLQLHVWSDQPRIMETYVQFLFRKLTVTKKEIIVALDCFEFPLFKSVFETTAPMTPKSVTEVKVNETNKLKDNEADFERRKGSPYINSKTCDLHLHL